VHVDSAHHASAASAAKSGEPARDQARTFARSVAALSDPPATNLELGIERELGRCRYGLRAGGATLFRKERRYDLTECSAGAELG
jgi:hypothetical protein